MGEEQDLIMMAAESSMTDSFCRRRLKCFCISFCFLSMFLVVLTSGLYNDTEEQKAKKYAFDDIHELACGIKEVIYDWAQTVLALLFQTFAAFTDPAANGTLADFNLVNDSHDGSQLHPYSLSSLSAEFDIDINDADIDTSVEGETDISLNNPVALEKTSGDAKADTERESYERSEFKREKMKGGQARRKTKDDVENYKSLAPVEVKVGHAGLSKEIAFADDSVSVLPSKSFKKPLPSAAPTQEPTLRNLQDYQERAGVYKRSGSLHFEKSEQKAAAVLSILPAWLSCALALLSMVMLCVFFLLVQNHQNMRENPYRSDDRSVLLSYLLVIPAFLFAIGNLVKQMIRPWCENKNNNCDNVDMQEAHDKIESIVGQFGGCIEETHQTSRNLTSKQEITMNISCPERNFDVLVAHVKSIFVSQKKRRKRCRGFVLTQSSSRISQNRMRDSSETNLSLVQIQQRYKSLMKFMDITDNVTEALAIQKELNQMEETMERLKREIHMRDFASLTIKLTEHFPSCNHQPHSRVTKENYETVPQEWEEEDSPTQKSKDDIESGYEISMFDGNIGGTLNVKKRMFTDDIHRYKIRLGSVYVDTRAVVRIAVYDTFSKTFKEQTSGFVANSDLGLIVTCAHLIYDPVSLAEKYPIHETGSVAKHLPRYLIAVGVIRDEREAPEWQFQARVVTTGNTETKDTFVDALVLQVTGKVESHPVHVSEHPHTLSHSATSAANHHHKSVFRSVELKTSTSLSTFEKEEGRGFGLLPASIPMGISSYLHVNDPVTFLGFPSYRGETICCDSAVINQLDHKFINCTAFQHAGSSGGPLINRHGEVIGIMSKGFRPGDIGQHLAVDLFAPLVEEAEHKVKYTSF